MEKMPEPFPKRPAFLFGLLPRTAEQTNIVSIPVTGSNELHQAINPGEKQIQIKTGNGQQQKTVIVVLQ